MSSDKKRRVVLYIIEVSHIKRNHSIVKSNTRKVKECLTIIEYHYDEFFFATQAIS